MRRRFHEPTSVEAKTAAATGGELEVVGDEQERGTAAGLDGEEELGHCASGSLIEIAGRLVGQEDVGLVRERAGKGHALLLAARKLGREMVHPVRKPDLGEELGSARLRIRPTEQFHRQGDVLARGHRWHEMEGLEQDADVPPAKARELVLAQAIEFPAAHHDAAAGGALDAADDGKQARFSRARGTHDAHHRPGLDRKIDPAQDRNRSARPLKDQVNVFKIDHDARRPFSHVKPREDMDRMARPSKLLRLLAALAFPFTVLHAFASSPEGCRIAVLGDSLTAGLGLPAGEAFPARLEAALRARGFPCAVIDAGVSGDTSAGGAARIAWVLADRPSHLLVELGGNDALRALPPEQLEENLERIVLTAKNQNVAVMIAGMLAPTNLGPEYGAAFAAAYQKVVDRHQLAFYPFFLDGLVDRPDLFQKDGIHPNAAGVAEIVARILPTVEAWLRESGVLPRP